MVVREANVDTPYRVADIRVDKNKHPIYGEAPFTQQSRYFEDGFATTFLLNCVMKQSCRF